MFDPLRSSALVRNADPASADQPSLSSFAPQAIDATTGHRYLPEHRVEFPSRLCKNFYVPYRPDLYRSQADNGIKGNPVSSR